MQNYFNQYVIPKEWLSVKNERKRLCIVSPCHWSGSFGGAEQQMSLLMDVLVSQGQYEITYVTRQADPNYRPAGYRIEQIAASPISMRVGNVLDARQLLRILRRVRPHVIYQRVGGAYTGIAANYALRNNCKMVWHISSDMNVMPYRMDINKSSNFVSRYIEKKLLEYGIRNSNCIIAQTQHQAEMLSTYFGVRASKIVPNYQLVPAMPEKMVKPVNVVWVSNFKRMKRPELYIDLAKEFRSYEDIRFIMIGRAENSVWGRQIVKKMRDVPSLEYLGEKTQKEVNQILGQSHIFVNTSSYEGFPNTFIQSWMRGVPVVSLDVNPDNVLSSHNIGYCSGSFAQLCRDVELLIKDSGLRQSMGNAARSYATENHSERNIYKIIEEL